MKFFYSRFYKWLMRRRGALVRCADCPFWKFHSETFLNVPKFEGRQIHRIGVCKIEEPRLYNMNQLGMAFRAMFENDFCAKHPLHVAKPLATPKYFGVAPSDVSYAPGEKGHEQAGFNRAPTLDEALLMSQFRSGFKPQFNMGPAYGEKPADAPENDKASDNG
jgi:hypothetical protein